MSVMRHNPRESPGRGGDESVERVPILCTVHYSTTVQLLYTVYSTEYEYYNVLYCTLYCTVIALYYIYHTGSSINCWDYFHIDVLCGISWDVLLSFAEGVTELYCTQYID